MARSYERIDYGLRPAKNIERKMLCEVFQKLSDFATLDSYRYVGFGSPYFNDFSLVHRSLGITHMISVEKEVENRGRFEFNKPFACIELRFGESNSVLPALPWNLRTIAWLDYDGPLDAGVLADVETFCANAVSGSVLVVTVNAHPVALEEDRVEKLRREVGAEKVPPKITAPQLAGWGTARTFRRIIVNEIMERLRGRNGATPRGSRMEYRQLFNFHYADGAKMLTVGGLLFDEGQSHIVAKCEFEKVPFVRGGDDPYAIEVPALTYRELRHLDSQLPCADHKMLKASGVREGDITRYAAVYRYFPTFAEAEM